MNTGPTTVRSRVMVWNGGTRSATDAIQYGSSSMFLDVLSGELAGDPLGDKVS